MIGGAKESRRFNVCPWEQERKTRQFSCGHSWMKERDGTGLECVTGDDANPSPLLATATCAKNHWNQNLLLAFKSALSEPPTSLSGKSSKRTQAAPPYYLALKITIFRLLSHRLNTEGTIMPLTSIDITCKKTYQHSVSDTMTFWSLG
mmetsp:Transcript_36636/g.76876  ORF Transcript_36636/g.76876 Transcript_36636/m.76876 type:complete len:148 (-) Transcript_36636:135-578(-)